VEAGLLFEFLHVAFAIVWIAAGPGFLVPGIAARRAAGPAAFLTPAIRDNAPPGAPAR
jgi:hypothetical protein